MKKIIYLTLALIALPTSTTYAHVRYLVNDEIMVEKGGFDFSYFISIFSEKLNIFLMIITVIVVSLVWLMCIKVPFVKNKLKAITDKADSYTVFTPWMLRLSLGIALIGSGISHTLISPVLTGFDYISSLQILLGFSMMSGFLVVPSALVVIGLYIYGLSFDFYILGNFEFIAAALSLLMLRNEKPGIDDLLNIPNISPLKFLRRYVPLVLRIGIGGSMIFLAVYEKFLNPYASEVVVREFGLLNVVPVSPEMWVFGAGSIELFIGLLILVGLYTRTATTIAFFVLSLSFFYFNEDVASHITLFGVMSVLFVTRGGALSFDKLKGVVNRDFV